MIKRLRELAGRACSGLVSSLESWMRGGRPFLQAPVSGKSILLVLLPGLLCAGALTVVSFAVPAMAVREPGRILHQRIEYDYRFYPVESALYPAGTEPLPPGEESFFLALMEKVRLQVAGTVEAVKPIGGAESDMTVKLLLRQEGGWRRELPLKPEVTISEAGSGLLRYEAAFDLPLGEAIQLGEAILTELQGMMRGEALSLVIVSLLSTTLPGSEGSPPEGKRLCGEYEFVIDGALLLPGGELIHEDSLFEAEPERIPNHIRLPGVSFKVSTGRLLFPILCLVLGSAAACCYIEQRRDRLGTLSEYARRVARTRKLCGIRIAKAVAFEDGAGLCRIELAGCRELIKVADEVEKPIIEIIPENSSGEQQVLYCVVDGAALYCYGLKSAG